jgi:predicted transcriptional regulator/DNA-binding XRE family transcriptional regulator
MLIFLMWNIPTPFSFLSHRVTKMNFDQARSVAAVLSEGGHVGRVIGDSLKRLREVIGVTQEHMAQKLGVGQATISKIEHRGDVQISSLQRYVEALGATLRIEASFPANAMENNYSEEKLGGYDSDDCQLTLPIFEEVDVRPIRDIIISIRPRYSEKILEGKKTVELRRRFPTSGPKGAVAYIYSTSPVRAIVGRVNISDVVKLPISEIWERYAKYAYIEKRDFDSYFAGVKEGFALEFDNVKSLRRPLDLFELRERFSFNPPQSFQYAKPGLRRALQDECTNLSD